LLFAQGAVGPLRPLEVPYELNAPYEWVWWRSDHEQQDQRRATFAYGRRITGRRVAGRCHAPASHGSSRALPEAARKIHRKSAPMLPGSVSTLPGEAAIRSFDRCHGVDFELVQPDTEKYFEGLFRRASKAWTLGDAIDHGAGVAE
jgi:hypothetical protein